MRVASTALASQTSSSAVGSSALKLGQRLGATLRFFTVLALLIASLGLFGLAEYTASQRTKEVGIRKVLGATIPGLVAVLSKDFLKLVVIAFILGTPVA